MEHNDIRPYRRTPRWMWWWLAVAFTPLVVQIYLLVRVLQQQSPGMSPTAILAARPELALLTVLAIFGPVIFMWGQTRGEQSTWRFSSDGLAIKRGRFAPWRDAVRWADVTSTEIRAIKQNRNYFFLQLTIRSQTAEVTRPSAVRVEITKLPPQAASELLGALVARVPAPALDALVIIAADLVAATGSLHGYDEPALAKALRNLDALRVATAAPLLEDARAQTTYAAWLDEAALAQADCSALLGRDAAALAVLAPLAGSRQLAERVSLVTGLLRARTGDLAGATRDLAAAASARADTDASAAASPDAAAAAAPGSAISAEHVAAAHAEQQRRASAANLPLGWTIAALAPAVLVALLVVGSAAFDLPKLGAMTTDARGNIYALYASNVYRFDSAGREQLAADRSTQPDRQGSASQIAVAPDNALYVAETNSLSVAVFDATGRYRTTLKTGTTYTSPFAFSRNIAVSPDATGAYVFAEGSLFRIAPDGDRSTLAVASDLREARGMAPLGDSVLIADTEHARLLQVSDAPTRTIAFPNDAGDFRYPTQIRVAPDGTVYVVAARKRRHQLDRGTPVTASQMLALELGRLYRVDMAARTIAPVDVRFNGSPLNVWEVAFLPDGALVLSTADSGYLYRIADPAAPASAQKLALGDLGRQSFIATLFLGAETYSIPLLFVVGILLPVVIGATGLLLRNRKQLTSPGMIDQHS
jgi:hypothetical protein